MTASLNRIRALTFASVAALQLLMGCTDIGTAPVESPIQRAVSFSTDIKPILTLYGCDGCHGGSGGLYVETVAQLMRGGIHGPAVVPGEADSSLLIRKLSATPPFGDRMPRGSAPMPDVDQQKIRRWIIEGAQDN